MTKAAIGVEGEHWKEICIASEVLVFSDFGFGTTWKVPCKVPCSMVELALELIYLSDFDAPKTARDLVYDCVVKVAVGGPDLSVRP